MNRNDIFRIILHIPVGIICFIGLGISWALGMVFFLGFMVYELNEDMHLKDSAYKDILGFMVGLGATILAFFFFL